MLDVSGICNFADYFVISSANNTTQLKAIADQVIKSLARQEVRRHHREGEAASGWVLLDYGDVIVHLFLEESRTFYDLERLWADAERLETESEQG